jgi:hypothetical protein
MPQQQMGTITTADGTQVQVSTPSGMPGGQIKAFVTSPQQQHQQQQILNLGGMPQQFIQVNTLSKNAYLQSNLIQN